MDFFCSTELHVPVPQIMLLLILITTSLLFGRIRLVLMITYAFYTVLGLFFQSGYILRLWTKNRILSFYILYLRFFRSCDGDNRICVLSLLMQAFLKSLHLLIRQFFLKSPIGILDHRETTLLSCQVYLSFA